MSSLVPHLTHCPSSRSHTAFRRFAGITGSPALVISSNHLGMVLGSPLDDRPRYFTSAGGCGSTSPPPSGCPRTAGRSPWGGGGASPLGSPPPGLRGAP